jgi:hypothetical protein
VAQLDDLLPTAETRHPILTSPPRRSLRESPARQSAAASPRRVEIRPGHPEGVEPLREERQHVDALRLCLALRDRLFQLISLRHPLVNEREARGCPVEIVLPLEDAQRESVTCEQRPPRSVRTRRAGPSSRSRETVDSPREG